MFCTFTQLHWHNERDRSQGVVPFLHGFKRGPVDQCDGLCGASFAEKLQDYKSLPCVWNRLDWLGGGISSAPVGEAEVSEQQDREDLRQTGYGLRETLEKSRQVGSVSSVTGSTRWPQLTRGATYHDKLLFILVFLAFTIYSGAENWNYDHWWRLPQSKKHPLNLVKMLCPISIHVSIHGSRINT